MVPIVPVDPSSQSKRLANRSHRFAAQYLTLSNIVNINHYKLILWSVVLTLTNTLGIGVEGESSNNFLVKTTFQAVYLLVMLEGKIIYIIFL